MTLFISKYSNNLDKKGRVSVPASFRSILSGQSQTSVILYPSIRHRCIEGCSYTRLESISKAIATLDPYSEERDAFETIILAESVQLSFDNEGRVILPKPLVSYASLDEQVIFVGKGEVFEIWNPQDFDEYLQKAKNIAMVNKGILKNL